MSMCIHVVLKEVHIIIWSVRVSNYVRGHGIL